MSDRGGPTIVRLAHILVTIAVVLSISLPGCAEEQEDPRDRLVEILQLTDEQLEQLETGTGTLHLREDQVNILTDYVAQLLDDLQPWLDESQWQEVKGILEAMLAQGEVDLQTLGPVAEAIRDSLLAEAEAGIGVYTNLVRLSTESTATIKEQGQLAEESPRSTCVTVYTPRNSIHGDKHYELQVGKHTYTRGQNSESTAAACSNSGAIGVYSYADILDGATAYALQRILINVPVDASDITITTKLLYSSATRKLLFWPFGAAGTGVIVVKPYQLHEEGEVFQWEIDSMVGWDDALNLALSILTMGYSVKVQAVKAGLGLGWTGLNVLAYEKALKADGKEKTINYSEDSLPAGDYVFEIGVYTRIASVFDICEAFIIGMVPEIEVSMNIPSLALDIASTEGGYVIEPGEGAFPCCPGKEVDIVAISYPGYQFVEWTGDVGTIADVDSQMTTITMNGDYSISANFEEIPSGGFDLTTSSTSGGSVTTPGEGTFTYDSGTVVDLVAVAEEGYYFVNWSGDVDTIADINDPTTTITMTEDYSITANFEEEEVVTFPDPNLEAVIREAIGKPESPIYASDLEELASLDASGRGIVDLTGLEYCTSLTHLDLAHNGISNCSPLRDLTNLIWLSLSDNGINVYLLGGLPNLTHLDLSRNGLSDIWPLGSFTNLTWLSLSRNQEIGDIRPLASMTSLGHLDLRDNRVYELSPLASLTSLTYLDLAWNWIRDVSPLASLTNLTHLALRTNLDLVDISPLGTLTSLTYLDLGGGDICDISPLATLTNLTNLDLDNNNCFSDLSPLTGLTNLTNLSLWLNWITDIEPLVDNTELSAGDTVDLRSNPLSSDSINIYIPELQARGVTVYF